MSSLIRYPNRRLFARDPFAFARELFESELAPQGKVLSEFAPSFDVKETDDAYVIAADLPGVKDEDLEISLTGNHLTIGGSRQSETKSEGDNYFVTERSYGSFKRSFLLPEEADSDEVEADLAGGVLIVKIGKKAQAQPKRITIKKA